METRLKRRFLCTLAALLIAGEAFVSCVDPVVEEPTTGDGTFTMTVTATKDAPTKALAINGSGLSATWTQGDKVDVYKGINKIGELTASDLSNDGTSAKLSGTLDVAPSVNDVLTLEYLSPSYATQDGTLTGFPNSIDKVCDYATATVTVKSISDGNITIKEPTASFANKQAIVKFLLTNCSASTLTISAGSNKLVKSVGWIGLGAKTYHSGYTADSGSNGYNTNEDYDKLLDGNTGTKWCGGAVNGEWTIEFHTASAVSVDGYKLTTGGDTQSNSGRNPKSWTLEAKANSGGTWAVIDTKTNNTDMPAQNKASVDFNVDVPGDYQYFRFKVSAVQSGTTLQLSEMQLFGFESRNYTATYDDITIIPASATNALTVALRNESEVADTYRLIANAGGKDYYYEKSGVTFTNGQYYEISVNMLEPYPHSNISILQCKQGSNNSGEDYAKLFDGNKNNKWCTWGTSAGSYANRVNDQGGYDQVIWKTASSIVLSGYTLTTGNDTKTYPGRNWKTWAIYGANFSSDDEATIDATGWTQIQRIENDNVLQATNNTDYFYIVSGNSTAYQYYRLVIEDIQSTTINNQQMSEMTLYTK